MVSIEIIKLVKHFGDFKAVKGISFEVEKGTTLALLGPSGCGKTTTLRCIAGLEKPSSGTIVINGKVVNSSGFYLPSEKRSIGMVFQSYAIWPHMKVFGNVAFPLKIAHQPAEVVHEKVKNVLKIVGLEGFGDRLATKLSGGQQQQVALARALVAEPSVVLFDEPLSNLDAKLRDEMRFEIKSLQKRIGLTAIYVTHDREEAMVLADQIALMKDGEIVQCGSPEGIYNCPLNDFVAEFFGAINKWEGTCVELCSERYAKVRLSNDHHMVGTVNKGIHIGMRCIVAFRPDAVNMKPPHSGELVNELRVGITNASFLGERYESEIVLDPFRARVSTSNAIPNHDTVIYLPAEKCYIVPALNNPV